MLHNSIHELLFCVFKEIILKDNLKPLVISGEPTEQEMLIAWEEILEQYASAIGESDRDGYLKIRRELLYYITQKNLLVALVEQLKVYYVPKWAKLLNKVCQSSFKFDPLNREEYFKLLDRCIKRGRGLIDLQLKILTDKKDQLDKKRSDADNLKPTEEFFAKVLLNLHEFNNWQFDDNKITVYQYCEMAKRYNQHIEYLESEKQNNGRR
jgi:hypothetical protein